MTRQENAAVKPTPISTTKANQPNTTANAVPVLTLLIQVIPIAAKIMANAPLAVQYSLEAVNKGMEMTLSEGLYLEAVLFGVACATEDKKEGTTAFLEKRAAQFKGK